MSDNTFELYHGKLKLNIPRKMFRGIEAEPVPEEIQCFRKNTMARYPWISENAMEIILRNARREMLRVLDDETNGMNSARIAVLNKDYETAEKLMRRALEKYPNNSEYRTEFGIFLMSIGKHTEGHKYL